MSADPTVLRGPVIDSEAKLRQLVGDLAPLVRDSVTGETSVPIESIRMGNPHRRDLGDIEELARSIQDIGLIHPIGLTPDLRILVGRRRLEAFKLLGRTTIPARILTGITDAAAELHAERDENVCRKDMLLSELAALGEALYAVEAEAAKERQRQAGREHGRGIAQPLQGPTYSGVGKSAAVVGGALGMSESTYTELRFAHKVATDPELPETERDLGKNALEQMDSGRGVQPTVKELRRNLKVKREAQEVKQAALHAPPIEDPVGSEWVPAGNDKAPVAVARRRELIRDWADKGWTSGQIADRLHITEQAMRRIARDEGVTVIADVALGRGTRKSIDSNRIVRETVAGLEGLELALNLVRFEELDASEIPDWTTSLKASIGVLTRLNRRLKEIVQ